MEKFNEMLAPLMEKAPEVLMNLLYAVIIVVIGKIIVGLTCSIIKKIMHKSKTDETLIHFVVSLINIALMAMVIIAAINRLGIQTTSFVAVMGAAGLAVGLALQGSLSNFAAGVLMIIFKPIKVNDYIEGAGIGGIVMEISIFTTILKTPDNKKVIVPNAKLAGDNIINYTALGTRRVDMTVGISYSDNIQKTQEILMAMLKEDKRVLKSPEPVIGVEGLGASSVDLAVRPWVNANEYLSFVLDMNQRIKETLDENNVSIPFPQRDVNVYHKTEEKGEI